MRSWQRILGLMCLGLLAFVPRAYADCTAEDAAGVWVAYSMNDASELFRTTIKVDKTGRIVRGTTWEADGTAHKITKGKFTVKSDCTVTGSMTVPNWSTSTLTHGTLGRDGIYMFGIGVDNYRQHHTMQAIKK